MPRLEKAGSFHSTASKTVSIAEPEHLTPGSNPRLDRKSTSHDAAYARRHRVGGGKRLFGKPAFNASTSSFQSTASLDRDETLSILNIYDRDLPAHDQDHKLHLLSGSVISQVADWLKHEKAKKNSRRTKKHKPRSESSDQVDPTGKSVENSKFESLLNEKPDPTKSPSDISDDGVDLDQLEKILSRLETNGDLIRTPKDERKGSYFSHRPPLRPRALRRSSTAASSDTERLDGDALIPSAEVILDNSKALAYGGGAAKSQIDLMDLNKRVKKETEAWIQFKNEIIRLAHTLRLKGWRRVPLDRGEDIDVERLSGALTNAVYVVSPPSNLPQTVAGSQTDTLSAHRKVAPPQKLLLRVYGPQAEHLIDRENELEILRRLRRKKIGPNLLGTFINGRFEQYYHARTLTARDLRIPQTSKLIAKRMRELHDGVELLDKEREDGASVWRNWDKWVERCEQVICWLDRQILSGKQGPARSRSDAWKRRGLVCGVEWAVFRQMVDRYRSWLAGQCGGLESIKQQLVFAHNDTQYGNLLRVEPPGTSPLLMPENEHKQLIVIDFEYASANVPGLEFANHFTEWCYNYHDPSQPHALNSHAYPTPDEQRCFLKAYVQHHPFTSPAEHPSGSTVSSSSSFTLDSRAPPAQIAAEERLREQTAEAKIQHFMHNTRLWRIANSAHWVAWGIVQAKVTGMDEALRSGEAEAWSSVEVAPTEGTPDGRDKAAAAAAAAAADDDDDDVAAFDYLGYAQERALFFWGDVLQLGLVQRAELPAEVLRKVKIVPY